MEIDDRINRLSTDRKLANIAAAIPGAGDRPVAPRMAQSDPRMAQGDPRMAQGDPRMLPSSGLAGISPPSAMPMAKGTGIPQAIEKPDPMQIMGGVAMAVLAETSKPTKNIIQYIEEILVQLIIALLRMRQKERPLFNRFVIRLRIME